MDVCLWLEKSMEQVLKLLVMEQFLTILSQETHSRVYMQLLHHLINLPRSCDSFKMHADRAFENEEEVTKKEMFYVGFGSPDWDITMSYFPSTVS